MLHTQNMRKSTLPLHGAPASRLPVPPTLAPPPPCALFFCRKARSQPPLAGAVPAPPASENVAERSYYNYYVIKALDPGQLCRLQYTVHSSQSRCQSITVLCPSAKDGTACRRGASASCYNNCCPAALLTCRLVLLGRRPRLLIRQVRVWQRRFGRLCCLLVGFVRLNGGFGSLQNRQGGEGWVREGEGGRRQLKLPFLPWPTFLTMKQLQHRRRECSLVQKDQGKLKLC